MKFISCNGYESDGSYIQFTIEDGKSYYCQGDVFWCNENELLISDYVSEDELNEWFDEVEIPHKTGKAIKGALRRMEII